MNAVQLSLSCDEREVARQLWDDLVLSPPHEAKPAQKQMVEAPAAVQQALITAIVRGLRSQQELSTLPNPFAHKE